MRLADVLQKTKTHFGKLGFPSASLDAELLLANTLGWERLDLFMKQDYPMTEEELGKAREWVRRRSKGEPVAYILGKKEFYNIELLVDSSVLIPRSETEHLVDEALAYIKEKQLESPLILDLGAGSGCIGLAILKEVPGAKLISVEKSEKAFTNLKKNAAHNSLEDRVLVLNKAVENLSKEDLGTGSQIDVLVSNPPYIAKGDKDLEENVLAFEPEEALFAEDNGLKCYRSWPKLVGDYMKPGSIHLFEIGHQQAKDVKQIFSEMKVFEKIEIIQDYARKDRLVKAYRS